MDVTTSLILIALLHGVLLFFDLFFKSCAHYPYIQFLKGTGFNIKLLQIRWNTTAFNRTIIRWGNKARFLGAWFTVGLYITLILLPISIVFLLVSIGANLFHSHSSGVVIQPIVPGIDLPGSDIGYYSLSLIVSSVVHEFGHALASVQEDVHLIDIGINIFFVLPVAYVNLSSDRLNSLNPWRALRILCAGVWHNLVLTLIAYLLYCTLPYCYSILFKVNEGAVITAITQNSPLLGTKGLKTGNILLKINSCTISNENLFYECLQQAYLIKPGYCIDTDVIHNFDESIPLQYTKDGLDCCNHTNSVCFETIEKSDGILEIPPHTCLPARMVIENSKVNCAIHSNTDCPNSLHCIKPLLDNSTSLIKITRLNKPDVIYIGHPSDLMQTIQVSSFIPRYGFSDLLYPDVVLKFLQYIIVISSGLALINVIPCLFMDGQHITNSIVYIISKDKNNSRAVSTCICLLSTFLLITHCVYMIWLKLI